MASWKLNAKLLKGNEKQVAFHNYESLFSLLKNILSFWNQIRVGVCSTSWIRVSTVVGSRIIVPTVILLVREIYEF